MKKNYWCVGLFGMPYLYQNGDTDFHLKMTELGIKRHEPLLCGLKHKFILADCHEYSLWDYNEEKDVIEQVGVIPTYTEEDFINEIKKQLEE